MSRVSVFHHDVDRSMIFRILVFTNVLRTVLERGRMRAFSIKTFRKWSKKNQLTDQQLAESVGEIEQGLIDAFLGGQLIKKRVARKGQGKSGGYRTILAYVEGEKAFFLYGFAKNEADNVSSEELRALQLIGAQFLSYDDEKIAHLIEQGEVFEIVED